MSVFTDFTTATVIELDLLCMALMVGMYIITMWITRRADKRLSPIIGVMIGFYCLYIVTNDAWAVGLSTGTMSLKALYAINGVYYFSLAVAPTLWFVHVCAELNPNMTKHPYVFIPLLMPAALLVFLCFTAESNQLLFFFDFNNSYQRGIFFGAFHAVSYGYLVVSSVITMLGALLIKNDKTGQYCFMTLYAGLVILFGCFQFLTGYNFAVLGFTVGLVCYFGYLVTRTVVLQENAVREQLAVVNGISEDFECVDLVELSDDKTQDPSAQYRVSTLFSELIPDWTETMTFTERLDLLEQYVVYAPDRESFRKKTRREVILREVEDDSSYFVSFRALLGGRVQVYEIKFTANRDEQGQVVNLIAAFHSIDEQMRQQEEQRAALESALTLAESANRAKTTFLNNMSHDIRTPMNAIIGYTGIASSHLDNPERVADCLQKISLASDHLLSLINDVLDMSRIESGKVTLSEKRETLSEIVHSLQDMIQTDVKAKGLRLEVRTAEVKDEAVICDKLRLHQILLNIVSNSIKYTPEGGRITFTLKQRGVTEAGRGRYEFRIADNGIGMSQEFLKNIFDPFTRASTSTISGIQGTGLGMSITKNFVDMMGGSIRITSEEGVGTETVLNFEFRRADPDGERPLTVPSDFRCLICMDDITSCMGITSMLRELGARPDWCTSGPEAQARAEDASRIGRPYALFLLDRRVVDADGMDTLGRILRSAAENAGLFLITDSDRSDIEEKARAAGATGFLSKPLFRSDLRETLESCLSADGGPVREEKKTAEVPAFTGSRILLVEDNYMNAEIATQMLGEAGFEVEWAEDGSVAVERMKSFLPGMYDLVLMDVQMPIMDGYEATRRIRALPDPAAAGITILAMTANAFEEDRRAAAAAGMNGYLSKPIRPEVLRAALAEYVKGA